MTLLLAPKSETVFQKMLAAFDRRDGVENPDPFEKSSDKKVVSIRQNSPELRRAVKKCGRRTGRWQEYCDRVRKVGKFNWSDRQIQRCHNDILVEK